MGDMLSSDRGMTPARRKMIHEHRRKADSGGSKLPFEIGIFKPKFGTKARDVVLECECGKVMYVTKLTKMVVCSCGRLCEVD